MRRGIPSRGSPVLTLTLRRACAGRYGLTLLGPPRVMTATFATAFAPPPGDPLWRRLVASPLQVAPPLEKGGPGGFHQINPPQSPFFKRLSIFSKTRPFDSAQDVLRQACPERLGSDFKRTFPLTLSLSKGVSAFFDSLSKGEVSGGHFSKGGSAPGLIQAHGVLS